MQIFPHSNQNGMILVLAMFMLALLSMIGIASMMTTTTDIEIATGERQYVETFYRAQAAQAIAAELMARANWDRGFDGGFDTITPDGTFGFFENIDDHTFSFRVIDPGFMQELNDSTAIVTALGWYDVWRVDQQLIDQLPACPPSMSASDCKSFDDSIGSLNIEDWTDVRLMGMRGGQPVVLADIDIDRIGAKPTIGGSPGGVGHEEGGADILYNVDVRARTETGAFNRSPSRQALGLSFPSGG